MITTCSVEYVLTCRRYARILSRVNMLLSPSKEEARKLLGWIACSPIPLTMHEIQQALTIEVNDTEGKARLLANLEAIKICRPIVEVADNYVQFVHFTVKEYVQTDHSRLSSNEDTDTSQALELQGTSIRRNLP